MSRSRITLAALVAMLGLAFLSLRPQAPGAGITKANYERITVGMTLQEVEAVLGCPPGDYTDGQALNPHLRDSAPCGQWLGFGGEVGVDFDPAGRVERKWYAPAVIWTRRAPLWDRLTGR